MKKCLKGLILASLILLALASCSTTGSKNSTNSGLESAKNYLFSMYSKGKDATATPSDFSVVDVVTISGVSYPVEWTSSSPENVEIIKGDNHKTTINVNEKTPEKVEYTLTATLTDTNGNSASTSFNYFIPQYKEFTWDEYINAKKDSTVVVKGVITGIMSKTNGNSSNCLYMQDSDGGYYVYNMADDPVSDLKLEKGMTVRATGVKDLYSGTHEVKNATIEVLDSSIKTVEAANWTEKYMASTSLKDAALTKEQALLVTIKDVEVSSQDTASGYYRFKKNGLESYVRISSSVCPISKENQAKLKSEHAEHFGWIADVTGVICVYDGAFYLTPVDGSSFVYKSLPEKTDSEKIDFELDNITLVDAITEDTTLALQTSGVGYESVKLEWSSDSPAIVVDGNKAYVTLQEEETVATLTLKATCGEETKEKAFTLSLDAAPQDFYVSTTEMNASVGSMYKYGLYQANVGKTLYFDGSLSGKYLSTTDKPEKAVDVLLEASGDGYALSFEKDGAKKYIEILSVEGKATITLSDNPTALWTINSETGVPVTMVDGEEYYLGCYKTYATMSASKTSYILGDNISKIGVSQFPGVLMNVSLATLEYKKIDENTLEENKPYVLALSQKNAGKDLHFTGEMSGKYLSTGNYAKSASVYVEKKDGGFALYFLDKSENKKYIEILPVDGKATIKLSDNSTALWTINSETGVPVTMVDGEEYYLGCYKTYETISASKTSYILGDNISKIGVSQFPCFIAEVSLVPFSFDGVKEVEEKEEYTIALEQNNAGKKLFYTGEMNGKYLATTTSLGKSANVYVEKNEDGSFALYTVSAGAKNYIEVVETDGKASIVLSSEKTNSWTINKDAKTPVTTSGENEYYLGCYKTYETISASKTSYILGDNLSKIGVSQFPIVLVLKDSL